MVAKAARVVFVFAVMAGLAGLAGAWSGSGAGYIGYDSEDTGGPTFAWDAPSGAATVHGPGLDDSAAAVTIPFTFTFMGSPFTSVNVCTNGFISFGTTSTEYINAAIPTSSVPNNLVCAFWDDLHTGAASGSTATGSVVQQTLGVSPNRRLVITWNNVTFYPAGSFPHTMTFQIALYETSNAIICQYQSMNDNGGALLTGGQDATIGIEDTGGAAGIQYALGTGSGVTPASNNIYSGLAIGYILPGSTPPWGGGGGGGAPPGGGGPGGWGPGGASRDNDNGDQGFNDLFCGGGASATGAALWLALALGAAIVGMRR
jgi:hypothetical protein